MTDTVERPEPSDAHPFELDRFQIEAISIIDAGRSVLVAAPTGAGKTVVAERGVELALERGRRAFYTTPIKALSNQKYRELTGRHGRDNVGLLTGDNAVNGDAPVVVMTTEVLRNMIYAGAPALDELDFVILDEVHYLEDTYRGPVWEEVIIHLPRSVNLICLSATVSNANELADWISTVRGPTEVVIEDRRPIELANLYLVGDRGAERPHLIPTLVDGRPNPEGDRFDRAENGDRRRGRGRPRRRYGTPRRLEVVEALGEREMLPAIYFLFSRAGCDDAASGLTATGLTLSSRDERDQIRRIAADHVRNISPSDLDVLGHDRWLHGLESGIAAHHAGMVPPFKEAVEECFAAGLVKLVFATETLALGINMPARSVVIEKLSKFNGETHEILTPGQYTQLTGRAGRRGIDTLGSAVVLWSPYVPFGDVAALASSRSFALRSAFRPNYNMAANLVGRYERDEAFTLLNQSFAQFQADRSVVRLEERRRRRASRLKALAESLEHERRDIEDYRRLRRALERAQRTPEADIERALARLRPGDVVDLDGEILAVLSVAHRKGNRTRFRTVNARRKVRNVGAIDLKMAPKAIGSLTLPEPYDPGNHRFQRAVAAELGDGWDQRRRPGTRPELDAPEADLAAHPLHDLAGINEAIKSLGRIERLERELADYDRKIRSRTESIARRFERVLDLLERWGYVQNWTLSERGRVLARTYHEHDLLIAESLAVGHLDGLDPPTLAAVASAFTYEHRSRNEPGQPWFPSKQARERYEAIALLAEQLRGAEESHRLQPSREPDPTFAGLAYAWASGSDLEILDDEELSGGDFVRNVKQLVDLLRQIGDIAPNPDTARAARQASDGLYRGVISASSDLGDE